MRVRAKTLGQDKVYSGYYNLVRRKPGDVFDLLDESHFSDKWMERVGNNVPKTVSPGEPREEDLIADGIIMQDNIRRRGRKRNNNMIEKEH